jgi:hypothetical protein
LRARQYREKTRAFNGCFQAQTNKYEKENKEMEEENGNNKETSSKSEEVIIPLHSSTCP